MAVGFNGELGTKSMSIFRAVWQAMNCNIQGIKLKSALLWSKHDYVHLGQLSSRFDHQRAQVSFTSDFAVEEKRIRRPH